MAGSWQNPHMNALCGEINLRGPNILWMWQQPSGQWWYCCFHALQKGDINKVVPIDKSSTVLSILLALIFLREGITGTKIVSVLLIGIEGIDSNLGTAIRTTVVLLMAWLMVFVTGKQKEIKAIEKKELCFICLSGIAAAGVLLITAGTVLLAII